MGLVRQLGRGARWFHRRFLIEAAAAVFAVFLGEGTLGRSAWAGAGFALLFAALLATRLWLIGGRFTVKRVNAPAEATEYRQLELTLLCGLVLLLQLSGGMASPLYPLLYLLLAAVGAFEASVFNRVVIVLCAVLFELLGWMTTPQPALIELGSHLGAILGFPLVVGALEHAWTQAQRKKHDAQVEERLQQAEQEADDYRLQGMTAFEIEMPRDKRRLDLQRSSVLQVGVSMGNVLDILEPALRPHTVAVYWLAVDETTVTLKAFRPQENAAELVSEPMEAGMGLIGAILKSKEPIRRNNLRSADRGLTHYREKVPLRTFLGVPLLEGEQHHLRGVLLADRKVDIPFGEDDEKLLQVAAREILRTMDTEKRLNLMDRVRNEAERLRDATEGLITAVNLQEVSDQIARSLREIFPDCNFTAVVLQESDRRMVIKAAQVDEGFGNWAQENLAQEVAKGTNLCRLAVQKGLILPEDPFDKRSRGQRRIFGERIDPAGLKSVKVAPLRIAAAEEGQALGVLVIGSTKAALFPERGSRSMDVELTLETISNIAALSIQNAVRYELLERLATTDALTGLLNRRRFFEILEDEIAAATRYHRPLSLIMTDIDFFKKINDSYGHQMGDEVLKRVARVLGEVARTTDRVCRFGGEEFTILLPQTDRQGGHLLAERFRTEIQKQVFCFQGQEFSISLSLGICTMPEFAQQAQELIHRADQALYHAKHTGRNRTIHFAELERKAHSGANHEKELRP